MNRPFFSIVIPTLNEEINLPVLLQSVGKQTDKDFEVIVADSGSVDQTKEAGYKFASRLPSFKFIQKKMKTVSQARNLGALSASGEFLLFLDADTEIEKRFIEQTKQKLKKHQLDASTVWNRAKKSTVGKFIFLLLNISMSLFQKIKPAANGPCMVIKKSLFNEIGGFDENIFFGEDFDLIQRAHKKKARFAVFAKPIVYVSTRRFEKEGLFLSLYKSIKAVLHQLILGPIKQPIFKYEMGGQYYENEK